MADMNLLRHLQEEAMRRSEEMRLKVAEATGQSPKLEYIYSRAVVPEGDGYDVEPEFDGDFDEFGVPVISDIIQMWVVVHDPGDGLVRLARIFDKQELEFGSPLEWENDKHVCFPVSLHGYGDPVIDMNYQFWVSKSDLTDGGTEAWTLVTIVSEDEVKCAYEDYQSVILGLFRKKPKEDIH